MIDTVFLTVMAMQRECHGSAHFILARESKEGGQLEGRFFGRTVSVLPWEVFGSNDSKCWFRQVKEKKFT